MKLVIAMKSSFSYERLKAILQKNEYTKVIETNNENIETINDLDDVIEFWQPQLIVLDSKIEEHTSMVNLSDENNVQYLVFDGDYESITERIMSFFEIEPEEEVEEAQLEKVDEKKIVYKERWKTEVKYEKQIINISSDLVFVCNLTRGSGSSFISVNLAHILSNNKIPVSILESPYSEPFLYHSSGMNTKYDEDFYSVIHEIENPDDILKKSGIPEYKGFKWNVIDPNKAKLNYDEQKFTKLLLKSSRNGLTFFDIGNSYKEQEYLFEYAHKIIVVIDPHPTRVASNIKQLNQFIRMMEEGKEIYFVINKWTSVINKEQYKEGMELNDLYFIPNVDLNLVYTAMFEDKLLLELPNEELDEFNESFAPLIKKLINLDIEKKKKKKFNIFARS